MVKLMTLNNIIKKLIVNNKSQYGILMGSIIFAVMMIGGYGLIQFSPTVTDVLVAGGSTMMISLAMFLITLIGTLTFVLYAHSLFLKYKSKEIGIFISLGIKKSSVKEIVVKELKMIILLSTVIGLVLSLPVSYLSWTFLTFFVSTVETKFRFGWIGLLIAIIFSIIAMAIMIFSTGKYINKVDVIKILKASDEIEYVKGNKYILGVIGVILVPMGIVLFSLSSISEGFFGKLSMLFLLSSLLGLYLVIIQITSIGEIVKKINPKLYYKNIVFFNLVKLKGNQYTKTLFVTTLLVGVTIFGVCFNTAPMIDIVLSSLDDPYDFTVSTSFQQQGFGENEIKSLADEYNVQIKDFMTFESLLISTYSEDYLYRNPESVISESDYKKISGESIDVKKGEFIEVYDSHAWYASGDEMEFINSTTQEIFKLKCVNTIYMNNSLSKDSYYDGRLSILDDEEYKKLEMSLDERFKVKTFTFNANDWKLTKDFSNALFDEMVIASDNLWCDNYRMGPLFELNKKQDVEYEAGGGDYLYEEINEETELMAKKWWSLNPSSRYDAIYNTIPEYAVYLLLIFYIVIIAFVSAVMIVGIKILNSMLQDKQVYKNITLLGSKEGNIKSIVSKQVMLVYFTPLILGTIITLFLFREFLKVASLSYQTESFLFACGVSLIVLIVQIIIFFFIRKKAIKECVNFNNN